MCFQYCGNSICDGRCMFSIYVISFFGLSTFYVFQAGSPPYLCHIVCHIVCHIMCVTFCVSHYVFHILCVTYDVPNVPNVHQIVIAKGSKGPMVTYDNCDKYCMAHGCATRKNGPNNS